MNSRDKGKRGERMLAQALTDAGFPARRGQQFAGGPDSPDVVCPDLADWHIEAKFVESARIRDWLAQAEGDANGKPWFIGWKRRRGPWLAVLKLEDLLALLREAPPAPTDPQRVKAPTHRFPE